MDYVEQLISKHRRNGLLIDTNILLLVAIGDYDQRRISNFKRTSQFTQTDYHLIKTIIAKFDHLLSTPNIMTEVDNLGRGIERREWPGFAEAIRNISNAVDERYIATAAVARLPFLHRIGITDSASISISPPFLLLTDDLPLHTCASEVGIDAINFNHIRRFDS